MPQVTVRYFAAARAAAGVGQEVVVADRIADVLVDIRARHDARFDAVLSISSLLVDGAQMTDRHSLLGADVELDVLPPFAGG